MCGMQCKFQNSQLHAFWTLCHSETFFKTQGKDSVTREQQNIAKTTRAHTRQSCAVEVFDVWHAKHVA